MRAAVDCHMVGQRTPGDAGNARYVVALVNAMAGEARPGDDVAALVSDPAAALRMDAVTVATVPPANTARLVLGAPRTLEAMHADAAVFTYVTPPRPPCPMLVAVHDAAFRMYPQWFSRRDRALLNLMVPLSIRRSKRVLALSNTAKADMVAALGVDPDRVRVVSPAPAPAFRPSPGAEERVRLRFGLGRYCLAVGDVHPRKNVLALAQAVTLLGDRDLQLVVVGRPGHEGRAIIARSGARWLGHQEDEVLADLYRAAAVTVYPSRYEGFGLPVVEAMACGSPVVASARGAMPEVAADAAILVEPEPAELAEGIRAALEPATRTRLADAGPRRAARFSKRAMGEAAWAAVREAVAA